MRILPEPSPTGTPLLPPAVVPWLAALVAAAYATMLLAPEHTIAFKIAGGIVAFGALLGIASPGIRRGP